MIPRPSGEGRRKTATFAAKLLSLSNSDEVVGDLPPGARASDGGLTIGEGRGPRDIAHGRLAVVRENAPLPFVARRLAMHPRGGGTYVSPQAVAETMPVPRRPRVETR